MRTYITVLLLLISLGSSAAMPNFKEIDPKDIEGNYIKTLSEEWAALSSGKKGNFNTMTVSWGAIGHLWQKPVVMIFIRSNRYTHEFVSKYKTATLTFFGGEHKDDLLHLGRSSGRKGDKLSGTKLTTMFTPSGLPTFGEGKLIIEGKMLYKTPLLEQGFVSEEFMQKNKSQNEPWHEIIIFEIDKVWQRK